MSSEKHRLICVGLGPGDPDLMSIRAHKLVSNANHIAYFRKKGRPGMARTIVEGIIKEDAIEYPMEYPVTTEIPFSDPEYERLLSDFYDDWADRLEKLTESSDVIALCEGDPFFYGSFIHLYVRLNERVKIEVVPGITGMSGCWTATSLPIAHGNDVLNVLMGTLSQEELTRHIRGSDAVVIMKTGRNLHKIRQSIEECDRMHDAWLIERGTMSGETVSRLSEVDMSACPYFAIVLLHGKGRRL
ncbi:MAG: precorrin-2 C(20)-methyltransferase [Methyloligellaceae bacterium]